MFNAIQFAQIENPVLWAGTAIVLFTAGIIVFLAKRYRRCPPNRILVKYGKTSGSGAAKCIHGGGSFIIPVIQSYTYLSLDPLQIEIPLKGALSSENIRINVPSVFTVAIGTTPATMQNAAERLGDLNQAEITQQARDIIFGQLRQVIAGMGIEDINRDRDSFLTAIQSSLEPELNKIGLVLINVNITDITDESGYIEAIGRKAASEAVQQAEIDVAEQRKKGAIGVAAALRDQEIRVAEAEKERQVGTTTATREQSVAVARLDKERVVGEQEAAFQRDAAVKDAERQMRVQVAGADAEAVAGENEAKARIADVNAQLRIKEADAYQVAETRRREAEASVLEAQYRAEAKAAEAEQTKIEAEQRAELEAKARAEKAKITVDAEAAADALRIEAEAEAHAIFLKAEAEARGEYEALAAKANGLRAIVESCGGSQAAFQMLMLEHLDHLSETAASAISNVKFDKVVVWDGGGQANGEGGAAGFVRSLGGMLPPLMNIMKDVGGVEMPEYLGKLLEPGGANGSVPKLDDAPAEEETVAVADEESTNPAEERARSVPPTGTHNGGGRRS